MYGFGINSNTLNYHVMTTSDSHTFRAGGTNGDGTELMRIHGNGNVGIGTTNPLGLLSVGDSSVTGSDGNIVVGKYDGSGSRHFKLGYNSNWDVVLGDFGHSNTTGTWKEQFKINYNAPANSFYINSNGDIGMGTASPSYKLHLVKDNSSILLDGAWASGNYHRIMGENAAKKVEFNYDTGTIIADNNNIVFMTDYTSSTHTERMRINNSGNVGIGTASPGEKLEVVGNIKIGGSNNELRFYEGTNYVGFEAPALTGDQIWVLPSADGTSGQFLQTDGSGTLSWATASGGGGGGSSVWTTSGSNIYYNSGNVGIGTASPSEKLHVAGSVKFEGGFALDIDTDASVGTKLSATYNSNSYFNFGAYAGHTYLESFQNRDIIFSIGSSNTSTERMRINSSGNVGIGTAAPSQKLDVRGSIRIGDGSSSEQDILFFSSLNGEWQVGSNTAGNGTNSNQFYIWDSAYRLTV